MMMNEIEELQHRYMIDVAKLVQMSNTLKVFVCFCSKYNGLQHKRAGYWKNVYAYQVHPWYVCASFGGRWHIPLPLILGNGDGSRLQESMLRVAENVAFSKFLPLGKEWGDAFVCCANYEHEYEEEYEEDYAV